MLTADLVRGTTKAGRLVPRFLPRKRRADIEAVAAAVIDAFRAAVGGPRRELARALAEIDCLPKDRLVLAGLQKLCEDRATFVSGARLDATALRRDLWERATAAHRDGSFDRAAIVARVAEGLGIDPDEIADQMFADLKDREIVSAFEAPSARALCDAYDVGVVQAWLLRATSLELTFRPERIDVARALFRKLRFFGLIHTIVRQDDAYRVEIDGPFSLFASSQRYGLKLATFFPAVLDLPSFTVKATIAGRANARPTLEIDHKTGLVHESVAVSERPEVTQFVRAFRALGSDYDVGEGDALLALPGERVSVPDLRFLHRPSGEVIYLEWFGHYSRASVFARVDLVKRGLTHKVLLVVPRDLRVSEELLEDGEGGIVMVYKSSLSARQVLTNLDGLRAQSPARRGDSLVPSTG